MGWFPARSYNLRMQRALRMRRSWYGLLVFTLLLPSCRSAGPKGPPAGPAPLAELLRPYVGALRVLPGLGDQKALTLRAGDAISGTCDVVFRVASVATGGGSGRFGLETVGLPRVGERRVRCKQLWPQVPLTLTGLPAGEVTAETVARIDTVLLTPEAYLRRKGTTFDHPAAGAPSEVASQLPDAGEPERRFARVVVAWPRQLLAIDALHHDPSRRARSERLVGFEAVVGTDGRLYRPQLKGSVDQGAQEAVILATLALWRFEPARRADGPLGARVALETVLRVY